MATRNYDPKKVYPSFNGLQLSGFAGDEFVSIEHNADRFSMDVGGHGDVTRVKSHDNTAAATVRLQAGSPINAALAAFAAADKRDGSGKGVFQMKDGNGTTLVLGEDAWIRRIPNIARGTAGPIMEWVFDIADLDVLIGGFES